MMVWGRAPGGPARARASGYVRLLRDLRETGRTAFREGGQAFGMVGRAEDAWRRSSRNAQAFRQRHFDAGQPTCPPHRAEVAVTGHLGV